MKKHLLAILIGFIICNNTNGQVICIYCYDQNAPVSSPVNNLINNGGFEMGCAPDSNFCPSSLKFSCYLTSWTCTGGDTLTYARVVDNTWAVVPEGLLAAYFGNLFCNACSPTYDDTLCLNQVDCEITGIPQGYPDNFNIGYGGNTGVSLATTPSALIPGNMYVLEFWTGGEWDNGTFSNDGMFAVDVGFGNIFLRNKLTVPVTGIGRRFIIVFNATTPYPTIKFTNWGHICSTCTELVLDDVMLYTIAEVSPSVPSCFSGTGDADKNVSAEIYPNPVTNELQVKTNDREQSEVIIYDVASQKILQQQFTSAFTLNTGQLAKGIYFYEVRNKNGVVKMGKLVKN